MRRDGISPNVFASEMPDSTSETHLLFEQCQKGAIDTKIFLDDGIDLFAKKLDEAPTRTQSAQAYVTRLRESGKYDAIKKLGFDAGSGEWAQAGQPGGDIGLIEASLKQGIGPNLAYRPAIREMVLQRPSDPDERNNRIRHLQALRRDVVRSGVSQEMRSLFDLYLLSERIRTRVAQEVFRINSQSIVRLTDTPEAFEILLKGQPGKAEQEGVLFLQGYLERLERAVGIVLEKSFGEDAGRARIVLDALLYLKTSKLDSTRADFRVPLIRALGEGKLDEVLDDLRTAEAKIPGLLPERSKQNLELSDENLTAMRDDITAEHRKARAEKAVELRARSPRKTDDVERRERQIQSSQARLEQRKELMAKRKEYLFSLLEKMKTHNYYQGASFLDATPYKGRFSMSGKLGKLYYIERLISATRTSQSYQEPDGDDIIYKSLAFPIVFVREYSVRPDGTAHFFYEGPRALFSFLHAVEQGDLLEPKQIGDLSQVNHVSDFQTLYKTGKAIEQRGNFPELHHAELGDLKTFDKHLFLNLSFLDPSSPLSLYYLTITDDGRINTERYKFSKELSKKNLKNDSIVRISSPETMLDRIHFGMLAKQIIQEEKDFLLKRAHGKSGIRTPTGDVPLENALYDLGSLEEPTISVIRDRISKFMQSEESRVIFGEERHTHIGEALDRWDNTP